MRMMTVCTYEDEDCEYLCRMPYSAQEGPLSFRLTRKGRGGAQLGEDDEIRLVAGYLKADVNSSNPLAYSFSGQTERPVPRASRAAHTPTYDVLPIRLSYDVLPIRLSYAAHTPTYETCTEMFHSITPTYTHTKTQALHHTNTLTHQHMHTA